MNSFFFKNKKFYLIAIVILLAGYGAYTKYKKFRQPIIYETIKVQKGDLKQTVEATGNIQSLSDLALRFETPGTLETVKVKEGDFVATGTMLAALRLADLNAAIAAAEANLNQKLAGATIQERQYYQAALNSAQAAHEQAKLSAANSVEAAESAVATAKNNLKLAEGGEESRIVGSAYQDAVGVLQTALTKLDDGLTQADNILGFDNSQANESFRSNLSVLYSSQLTSASGLYLQSKLNNSAAHGAADSLNTASSHPAIDSALGITLNGLTSMTKLLGAVSVVLKNTLPGGNLTQASLDAKKTTIETARAAINAQYTLVVSQIQAIADAKNSLSDYQIVYDKSLRDLTDAQANGSTSIQLKLAALEQARANLSAKISPPREVDVAYYRAALEQAIANRDKAILKAPQSGVVTKINFKPGEFVSVADAAINMLSPHYEIKVDIPEIDIAKLTNGQQVSITLDAFGEDTKFQGVIVYIDSVATVIQDVVYYKVTVRLADTDKPIKAGMTANVVINTAGRKNVLFMPLRAVRVQTDGGKYVRLLDNGKEQQIPVQLGLKADDGKVEILSGLIQGQNIILSAQQYAHN